MNAEAAMECGKFEMARMWKILKILIISAAMPTSSLNSLEDYSPDVYSSMDDTLGLCNSLSETSPAVPNSGLAIQLDEDDSQSAGKTKHPLQDGGLSTPSDSNRSFFPPTPQSSHGMAIQGGSPGAGEGVSGVISLDSC